MASADPFVASEFTGAATRTRRWSLSCASLDLDLSFELDPRASGSTDYLLDLLPISEPVQHGSYAGNQIFCLHAVREIPSQLATDNLTVVPAAGEVVIWVNPARNQVEIGLFYDDHNLLISPVWGFTPVTVIGRAPIADLAVLDRARWRSYLVGHQGPSSPLVLSAD